MRRLNKNKLLDWLFLVYFARSIFRSKSCWLCYFARKSPHRAGKASPLKGGGGKVKKSEVRCIREHSAYTTVFSGSCDAGGSEIKQYTIDIVDWSIIVQLRCTNIHRQYLGTLQRSKQIEILKIRKKCIMHHAVGNACLKTRGTGDGGV